MVSHLGLLNLNIEKFRPYLQNDETLGEKDTVELHVLLQKLETRRKEINRTIDVLSITMEALRRNHDDLNASIFSYRSLVSPIRNIPDDVLGEIFTYTLPTKRNAFPIHTEVPLLLTSICKRWRNVAFSTPRLWSKLHVTLPLYVDEHIRNEAEGLWRRTYISTVKRFLGLSGCVPLSLSITYSYGSQSQSALLPESKELLDSVIRQSHRWCDIDIACSPETMQHINERIVKCPTGAISLPLLRRLRIRPFDVPFTCSIDDFNILHTYSMPSLRELSLDLSRSSPSFPFSKLQEAPYCQSLTRLTIHYFEYDVQLLLELLPRCQELQELLLGISEWTPLTNPVSVHLPKLTKLTLQGGSARYSSLYGYLETPLLTRLSLYPAYCYRVDRGEGEGLPKKPLVQDLIAQYRNLQSLVMSPRYMDADVTSSVFEADPGITTLILDPFEVLFKNAQPAGTPGIACGKPCNLMEVLVLLTDTSTRSASQPLLSNLRSCSILHVWIEQADADVILAFCKSRMVRHPTSASTGNQPPVASLDHIKMVLRKETSVVDVRKELLEYAQSIGRRVGEDIVIDITYPWENEVQWSPPLFDPRTDFDSNTGCTWNVIDA